MHRLLSMQHTLAESVDIAGKPEGFCLVDATAGNGHDSLFLLRLLRSAGAGPEFFVQAFDIQPAALENTRARIEQVDIEDQTSDGDIESEAPENGLLRRWRGHLLHHAEFAAELSHLLPFAKVGIAMFNLGFLPGSDKAMVTKASSTLVAMQSLCARMCPGGLLSVHCYAGHPGGEEETLAVLDFCRALDDKIWKSLVREFINKQRNRELLILVERLF